MVLPIPPSLPPGSGTDSKSARPGAGGIKRFATWMRRHPGKLFIVAVLLLLISVMLGSDYSPAELPSVFRRYTLGWDVWISQHPLQAALLYCIFYILAVSVSLPGALWFTIGAGYLLGAVWAIPVSLIGVTIGATNIFLVSRYVAGADFHARFDGRVARFASGFQRNDFSYMIILRMTPTPFFLVNIAAALLGARLRPYVAGTFIGAIPATILYANLGAGLGELVEAGVAPGVEDLTRPSFLLVVAMALLLALVPVIRRRRASDKA